MVISENFSENIEYDADTRIHYIMQNYALVMLANIDSSFHSERAQLTSNQSSTKTHIGEANRVYRYKMVCKNSRLYVCSNFIGA